MAGEATAGVREKETLKAIDIEALNVGSILKFPLYVQGEGDRRFKLLQGPNHTFTQNVFDRIQKEYQGKAYIYPEHVETFEETVKAYLHSTFTDPSIKPGEKIDALMHRVNAKLQAAMDNPDPYQLPEFRQISEFPEHVTRLLDVESDTTALILSLIGKPGSLSTHSLQVCMYGMMMVNRLFPLEFTTEEKEEIALGFIIHDIGKIYVDNAILKKHTKPTSMEWRIIQQTPDRGASVLSEWGIHEGLAHEIVRNHRERYNGTGYPRQLKGDEIPILARICCIADDFSSLTSLKPYRPALSPYDAVWIMRVENEGNHDPEILSLFVEILVGESENAASG